MRWPSPATSTTLTPIPTRILPGSRWLCSNQEWGAFRCRRRPTMVETLLLDTFLGGARVDDAVFVLRPDYRAVLLAVDGLVPGPSDEASEVLLEQAESVAREALRERPVEQLPHIAAWREAYRA